MMSMAHKGAKRHTLSANAATKHGPIHHPPPKVMFRPRMTDRSLPAIDKRADRERARFTTLTTAGSI
ncbi:hypothetical protein LX36DRAFT_651028 [Colletotrichum falcatum]|nr:hypothetical protein LX36DRAFT_651028 [Colletotrichum falcatum]